MSAPAQPLAGRFVLLGVTGSIAAYKAAELVRLLTAAGAEVQVLMTRTASEFIGPLTLETLSRRAVMLDPLELLPDQRIGHIVAADTADAVAGGAGHGPLAGRHGERARGRRHDGDLPRHEAPVVVAPAMDGGMYAHPGHAGQRREAAWLRLRDRRARARAARLGRRGPVDGSRT